MKSLSEKAGFLIFATFIKYAIGFLMPMVLVRMLSVEDYGSYQQLQLVGQIALGVMALGLPVSVFYFYGRGSVARQATLRLQTVLLLAVSGCVAAALVVVFRGFIAQQLSNPILYGLLVPYSISVAFLIASDHFTNFMIAADRYRLVVVVEIIETVVRVVVLVLPIALGYGLLGYAIAISGYAVVRTIARTALLFGQAPRIAPVRRAPFFVGEQFAYALPLALTGCVSLINGMLDKALVAAFFTPVAYAIYSVGALEIPLDAIFQSSVANVLRASLPCAGGTRALS